MVDFFRTLYRQLTTDSRTPNGAPDGSIIFEGDPETFTLTGEADRERVVRWFEAQLRREAV